MSNENENPAAGGDSLAPQPEVGAPTQGEEHPAPSPPSVSPQSMNNRPFYPPYGYTYQNPYYPSYYRTPQKIKNKSVVPAIVGAAVLAVIVLIGIILAVATARVNENEVLPQSTITLPSGTYGEGEQPLVGEERAFVEAVERAYKSCVTVEITFGESEKASGSGVVWSEDGYILTNHHVVSGARNITITFSDGRSYSGTYWAGSSTDDLALIKITPKNGERFVPVELCDAPPRLGQSVFAVGNTVGQYRDSATYGRISTLSRDVSVEGLKMSGLLQHDALISRGNSGGGLFNSAGQLIGINSAKSSNEEATQIGFAIPMNIVMQLVPTLKEYRYLPGRPKLGITVVTVTSDNKSNILVKYPEIRDAVNKLGNGVYVYESSGSELLRGDKLLELDGRAISSNADVFSLVTSRLPGDEIAVKVSYVDAGGANKERTFKFTVLEKGVDDFTKV